MVMHRYESTRMVYAGGLVKQLYSFTVLGSFWLVLAGSWGM